MYAPEVGWESNNIGFFWKNIYLSTTSILQRTGYNQQTFQKQNILNTLRAGVRYIHTYISA